MASKKPGKRPAQKKPAAKDVPPESAAKSKAVEPKPATKKSPEVKAAVRVTKKNVKSVKSTSKSPAPQLQPPTDSLPTVFATEPVVTSVQPAGPIVANSQQTAAEAGPPQYARQISHEEIQHLAYLKWEAAGRPHGDGGHFWWEAERELLQQS